MDDTIVMISAGMKRPKKDFNPLNELNLYLNYGLLGLGTQLSGKGYKVKVFQGDYKSIDQILDEIESCNIDLIKLRYPIFVSIPSFFALTWANEFIDKLKIINKDVKVVAGGRWVIDNNFDWIKSKISNVDLFVKGYGENYIEKCLDEHEWINIDGMFNKQTLNAFGSFNYTILYNYKFYQPCIEVSRGCGMGCKFCVESRIKPIPNKEPIKIIEEAQDIIKLYGCNTLNFYFQASIFNPTIDWAAEFHKIYKQNSMNFNWRFETRVDSLNKNVLNILAKCGLKVIDLGLESASPNQLLKMGKTNDTKKYLERAEEILQEAHKNDIWIKLNILLYYGETWDTINETLEWLNNNKKYIKGISVNPLIIYRNGDYTFDYIKEIEIQSGTTLDVNALDEQGYMFIDLSKEITYEQSKKISLSISRLFMDLNDYYDLKSVCYYKRDTKFEDFKKVYERGNYSIEMLPFNLEER